MVALDSWRALGECLGKVIGPSICPRAVTNFAIWLGLISQAIGMSSSHLIGIGHLSPSTQGLTSGSQFFFIETFAPKLVELSPFESIAFESRPIKANMAREYSKT